MSQYTRLLLLVLVVAALSGCNGSSSTATPDPTPEPSPPGTGTPKPGSPVPDQLHKEALTIGLLPDTQGGGDNVAVHPMEAVLAKLQSLDTDVVIAVGDLTDHGTTREFAQWTGVAEKYREAGIEFLPLMGNHEDSYAYTVEWIENMKDYIPVDAVHMSGAEYLDYYVIRENVLIIALRYYHLPVAFEWIKQVVAQHRDEVDHIVIASHDGLIGAKYGETREMIVEGTKGDDRLLHQWDDIRAFFAKHDVIWVQGHEHMYQRSVIKAPVGIDPSSWTPDSGNYRLPQYTQIMSGNASYKGYEFRYGERELVQSIIQQKMNTKSNGSTAYDANAAILRFHGERVDFSAYYTEHTVGANEQGPKELAAPEWKLFDRFVRTTDRCERLVYPNSIPAGTRPVMVLDPQYWTNDCTAPDGTRAKLIGGMNDTFNRVESRTRTLSWTPGFSRAESQPDLMRLSYQFLFQYHQPWTPNLNGAERILANSDSEYDVDVPETTIDLKEHLTLSWLGKTGDTLSDILIVSGTQQQTGTYSSAYGMAKDIEADTGLPGSQPDGSAKAPVVLPETATKRWDLSDAVSDRYVLELTAPSALDAANISLAQRIDGDWHVMASPVCVISAPYNEAWLTTPPPRAAECADEPLVGYDDSYGKRWWAVLDRDIEIALVGE